MKATKSLLVKIMIIILCVTFATITAMGWLNYKRAEAIIIDSLQKNAESQVTIHASQLGTWLQSRVSEVEVMSNIDLVRFGNQSEILKYFSGERKRSNGQYSSIGIGDSKGNLTLDAGITIQIGSESTFAEVMAGKTIISNPFRDKADEKNLIISFETPVYDKAYNIKGLISGASPINKVFKEATNFKVGKTDKVYVLQQDGLLIHHPDQTKVLQENLLKSSNSVMKNLAADMIKNKQGFSKIKIDDQERMVFYSEVPNTNWIMALDVPLKEFTSKLQPLLTITIVSGVVTLILTGLILFLLLKHPFNRIRRVVLVADQIAEGHLSVEQIEDPYNDEVSQLSSAMNKMVINLRELLKNVHYATEEVTTSSNHFIRGVDSASSSSESITNSAQEVAATTDLQLEVIKQNAQALDQLAIGIQRVAESSSYVLDVVTKTEQEAVQGNDSINLAIKQIGSIQQSVRKSSDVIQLLANHSKEIDAMTGMITTISEQTNLLALNAAIEAARAREHGKGFAIVADEVRKLAEQSKDSADKISSLIHEIQEETDEAVQAMTVGTEDVQTGIEIVNKAGDLFNTILVSIKKVTEQIQEVSASSEQMAAATEEINSSSDEMINIAQNATKDANIVTNHSASQLTVIKEMTESTAVLTNTVSELQESMKKFTL